MAKKDKRSFEIYTGEREEVERALENVGGDVKVLPPIGYDRLPEVYNSAGHVVHLPRAPFHIGDRKLFDVRHFRDRVEQGSYDFWRAVDLSFHGLYERSSLWTCSKGGKLPPRRLLRDKEG